MDSSVSCFADDTVILQAKNEANTQVLYNDQLDLLRGREKQYEVGCQ